MKLSLHPNHRRALTLIEVMFVIVVVLIIISLAVVNAKRQRIDHARIFCVGNLKNNALSFRVFSNDHDNNYPYRATNSLVFSNETAAWLHYYIMSNELGSAKLLICSADRERLNNMCTDFSSNSVAPSFGLAFQKNKAVSYFIGLEADETRPATFLVGDRNLETNSANVRGSLLTYTAARPPSWTPDFHGNGGNVALSDGSVQQLTTTAAFQNQARDALLQTGLTTNRLLMPW